MSSQNPRGNEKMRRIQAVLNARYPGEREAVEFLDQVRERGGEDRALVTDALLVLRERETGKAYVPPNFRETVNIAPDNMALFEARLTAAVTDALTRILSGMAISGASAVSPQQIRAAARESAAVSTANLVGESMRYVDDEDE